MSRREKSDEALHVLLADAGEFRPVLPEGLPGDALLLAAQAEQDPSRAGVPFLDRPDAAPNDLPAQRWGIVAPEGNDGDALLEAIAPLRALREHEQGAPAMVFRLPHLDLPRAGRRPEHCRRRAPVQLPALSEAASAQGT